MTELILQIGRVVIARRGCGAYGRRTGCRRRSGDDGEGDVNVSARLLAEMIDAERDVLKRMRTERAFGADVLREIERELDLDESRLRARIRL